MNFGICLDIILICLMALIMYLFMKKGFIRVTLSGLSFLISLGVSFLVTRLLAGFLANCLTPFTQRFIIKQSTRILSGENAMDTLTSASDKVMTIIHAVLKKINPEAVVNAAEQDSLYELSYGITYGFYSFLLFAVLFSLFFTLMRLLHAKIPLLKRFPVLKVADSSVSLIVGIIVCIIVMFIPAIFMFTILPSVLGSDFSMPENLFKGSLLLRLTYFLYPFR